MTTPVYDPNVPEKPSDTLAETQQPFLTNFGDLFAAEFLAQLSDEATLRVPAREVEEFLRTLR